MTQDSIPNLSAPRLAFLGFCERAETVTAGHTVFWTMNLLGVSKSRAFYVFPINLRGMTLAVALYQPQGRETFKSIFRGTEGQVPFEFGIQIVSAVLAEVQSDSTIKETEIDGTNPVLASEGWVFIASPITSDVLVYSQGVYKVFLSHASDEQYVGIATFVHIAVPPYTPQQITALKSDPLATKFVRLEIKCNVCHGVLKAYAGIERSSSLESQGFRWNLEIDQDEFICSCGKTRFSMTPI